MTNASVSLPRSWKCAGLISPAIGACFDSTASTVIEKAIAESNWPPTKMIPQIDEYQVGSSDITQSIVANVIMSPQITRPGPLIFDIVLVRNRLPVSSCSREYLFNSQ